MEPHYSTTPFGRRTLTLAHVACQAQAKARLPESAAHKWNVFRSICAAKTRLGVSERALAVLDALLSFHPETVLSGDGLIVFPSNQQLALRAHGMAPATLRRHLAALVDSGLIIRRDSPNGKRYTRRGQGGEIRQAFGFDLGPLVARAQEFERFAEEVHVEARALKFVREKITLCRRDIAKMIATGTEETVPTHGTGAQRRMEGQAGRQEALSWQEIHTLYRTILARVPRTATRLELEPIAEELSLLADEVLNILECHVNSGNVSANESQIERHIQNSKPDSFIDLEPVLQKGKGEKPGKAEAGISQVPASLNKTPIGLDRPPAGQGPEPQTPKMRDKTSPKAAFPLGMVLDACPDLIDYAKGGPLSARGGIAHWRDFLAAAAVVRPMLGISPSAWEEAQAVMGEINAAIVVAAILQRGAAIASPGGYLRGLTQKAEAKEFSLGPMLMALIGSRKREKKRA